MCQLNICICISCVVDLDLGMFVETVIWLRVNVLTSHSHKGVFTSLQELMKSVIVLTFIEQTSLQLQHFA